tara:strand:- start:1119 stop:1349 length:231 start_codon:yes stop_codon:yes gene_type:complete
MTDKAQIRVKRNKHALTTRQIKRRGYQFVTYWDNGWRYAYLTSIGRKWAKGRKSACGSPIKLKLSEKGIDWKEYAI